MKHIIVSIDGPKCIGCTSQINVLELHYKQKGYSVYVIKGNTPEYKDNIIKYLASSESETTVVLCDGSVISPVQRSIQNQISKDEILECHHKIIEDYNYIYNYYNTYNILLNTKSIDLCKQRLELKNRMYNLSNPETVNWKIESEFARGLGIMTNHVFFTNMKFQEILCEEGESILVVRDKILKLLDF